MAPSPRRNPAEPDDDDDAKLIQEVHEDDDLDMSTLGKPVAAFKQPKVVQAAAAADAAGPTASDAAKDAASSPKKQKTKKKKELDPQAQAAMWSQIDKEIEDVSDGDLDDSEMLTATMQAGNTANSESLASGVAAAPSKQRGVLPGGLSGGASLGSTAPLNVKGPKDHSYAIVNGEAKARVYDTPELRAAFLHYCNSSIKVSEMHLVHEGPFMSAQQFVAMCRDCKVMEPEGSLSPVMVGIVYTTSKSDDDDGLAFGQFLDALVSLAFEAEANVAGVLQAEWDKRDVLGTKADGRSSNNRPVRPSIRAISVGTTSDAAASGPVSPASSEVSAASNAALMRAPSRFREILDTVEPASDAPRPKKEVKARFQTVEQLGQSSVLDKVNELSKIKSMATSRATSVVNSRVASRMVSRIPSRRVSGTGGDDDDDEDDDDDDSDRHSDHSPAPLRLVNPSVLTRHVHAALQGYEGYEGDGEGGDGKSPTGASRAISMFAAQDAPPLSSIPAGLRPTTGGPRLLRPSAGGQPSEAGIAPAAPPLLPSRTLPRDLINKGFGDDDDDDDDEPVPAPARFKSPAEGGPAGTSSSPRASSAGADPGAASEGQQGKVPLKSALAGSRKLRTEGPTTVSSTGCSSSPGSSMRARFTTSELALPSEGSPGAGVAAALGLPSPAGTPTDAPKEAPNKAVSSKVEEQPAKPDAKQKKGSATASTNVSTSGAAAAASAPPSAAAPAAAKPAPEPRSSAKGTKAGQAESDNPSAGKGVVKGAADALKIVLLDGLAGGGKGSGPHGSPPDSPIVSNLANLPIGELLSPKASVEVAGTKAASSRPAAAVGPGVVAREAVALMDLDALAVMASFGNGVAAVSAAKAARGSSSGAAAPMADDAAVAKQKKRAEMEARMAAIEARQGGGGAGAKPKPPSQPAPGALTASPRASATCKVPASELLAAAAGERASRDVSSGGIAAQGKK